MKPIYFLLVAIALTSMGCVRTKQTTWIHDEEIRFILEDSVTTREDVHQALGRPNGRLAVDSVWIYIMGFKKYGVWLWCDLPAGECAESEGHSEEIDVLEISFSDSGVVEGWNREIIHAEECTTTGVCFIDKLFILEEDVVVEH